MFPTLKETEIHAASAKLKEVWLRGPIPEIHPLLQPVVHAFLQAREEVAKLTSNFPEELLWQRPAGLASVGFHLQHLSGVLDRLLTYARAETLNDVQLHELESEGKNRLSGCTLADLIKRFNNQVDVAMAQIKKTDIDSLAEARPVGRAQIPSTVIGLLVHAAEHTMRHVGQLLVTVNLLRVWFIGNEIEIRFKKDNEE